MVANAKNARIDTGNTAIEITMAPLFHLMMVASYGDNCFRLSEVTVQ
jgi:hypothetical protein